jgi:hypothetical protein
MRRRVEELEFVPGDTGPVVAEMARLAQAGDGWINLLPGVDEEEAEAEGPGRSSALSALFGSAQAPVTMGTWIPARPGRRLPEATVGIVHPRGRHAVAQLRDMGIPLPAAWRVRQDHNRRGLIVLVPAAASHAEVLAWALRAGAALATAPLTGSWQARIYQPSPR